MRGMRSCALFVLFVYLFGVVTPCFASYLSDEEIVAAARLIKELTAENESLARQVVMLEEGLERSEELVRQMSVQMQAYDAVQQSRNKIADDTIEILLYTLNDTEATIDKIERARNRAESRADFWRTTAGVLVLGAAVVIGSR